ncbi:MAG: DUF3105 domain-containing protein [Solirubrobacterales bacterium]
MNALLRTILLAVLTVLALGGAACGGSTSTPTDLTSETSATDETDTTATGTEPAEPVSTTPSVSSACSDVETFDVDSTGKHEDREFTIDDYATNPPTAGDHNPSPIETGQFYSDTPPLGEVVHALEHGAVIGWTNGLSEEDETAVEDAFNQMYSKGYYQLAVVEFPDLEGSFAMSSWDSLQRCESIDPAAITDFIENHYAPSTTAEALLACTGKAQKLPACKEL